MRPKVSTETNRGYQWNREEANSTCRCGAHIKRHRWVNPLTWDEAASAKRKSYKPPPKLRGHKRCYLCVWRVWCERTGCSAAAMADVESWHRHYQPSRCAA